jgi:hypothetical protein
VGASRHLLTATLRTWWTHRVLFSKRRWSAFRKEQGEAMGLFVIITILGAAWLIFSA